MEVIQGGILPTAAQYILKCSRRVAAAQTAGPYCRNIALHRDLDFSAEKAMLKLMCIRLRCTQKEMP